MKTSCIVGVVFASLLAACSSTPEEPSPSPTLAPPAAAAARVAVSGYRHDARSSLLPLGPAVVERDESGFHKVVGSLGTFAVVPETGFTVALLDADAPARLRPPFADRGDLHDARVRAYFVSGGLPADQILGVNAQAVMQAHGPASQMSASLASGAPQAELERYTSVLSRAIGGIPVADSFAWASFNADGEVTSESVYWPEVPRDVVEQAQTLRASLSSPERRAAFRAKLPADLPDGEVVMRHTGGMDRAFEAWAVYDVLDPRPMRGLRHFDGAGVEVVLPHESLPAMPDVGAKASRP